MEIKLTHNDSDTSTSIESAIIQRETKREYLDTPLSQNHLSRLLFSAQGIRGGSKLVAPSAHEQYPLSTYVVCNRTADIEPGIYEYKNKHHSLALIEKGTFSALFESAAIGEQPWVGNAAVVVVLAGNIKSMNEHFSDQPPFNKRGERYNYIEVGAVAQNMQLQGTALDVGMVLVGGFDNEEVQRILKLQDHLEPSALICIGNV